MNANDSFDKGDNAPNASELLDFEPLVSSSSGGRGMFMGIAAAIILAGIGVTAFFYLDIANDGELGSGPVPLILPPAGEVKARPENPGGMAVPDRDKLVYGRIDGSSGAPVFEQLLPPPETPLEPPTMAPTENVVEPADKIEATALTDGKTVEPMAPPPVPEPQPSPVPSEAISLAPPPPPIAEEKIVVPPAPQPAPQPAVKEEIKPTPPMPSSSSGYMVQLSALKTEDAAISEWNRIAKQHADVLGALAMNIQRADLGDKGIYWRLRAAYLPDRKSAEDVCAKLAQRKVGCLIIAP